SHDLPAEGCAAGRPADSLPRVAQQVAPRTPRRGLRRWSHRELPAERCAAGRPANSRQRVAELAAPLTPYRGLPSSPSHALPPSPPPPAEGCAAGRPADLPPRVRLRVVQNPYRAARSALHVSTRGRRSGQIVA